MPNGMPSADLELTLNVSRMQVTAGGDVTFVAEVTNLGPDAQNGALVQFT